jgi:putative transposase
MPRTPRCQLQEGIHHVTARGIPIFVTDLDHLDFLSLLQSVVREMAWLCHAYCLLGTHYHLVVDAPLERLSPGMRRLNGTYARRFNRRHGRRGHLFESRYAAWRVHDDRHLSATLTYVLDNPVRAGLCSSAQDWPWSNAARATA